MRFKNKENARLAFVSGNQPRFDGNTFSVRTEPGAQATKLPEPIPLLGATNKYVDVRYDGDLNIADNTVTVASMDQEGAEWRKFDCIDMKLNFNYLGLGMSSSDRNDAYNLQFRITQQDAISAAYASQLTELEFMALMIQSTVPQMDGFNDGKYTGSGQFAYLIWYQAFMQNLAGIMGKYNTLLSYADYLIKMGYNAEAHMTVRLINLLKKQNVWTLFDQAGNLLQSEFFDLDFYREITALNTIPCRQKNGVDSPLISLTGVVTMPDIVVLPHSEQDTMLFKWTTADQDQLKAYFEDMSAPLPDLITMKGNVDYAQAYTQAGGKDEKALARATTVDKMVANYSHIAVQIPGTNPPQYKYMSLEELFAYIMDKMSFPSILKWARNAYFNPSGSGDPARAYVNELIEAMVALVRTISHFRSDTSDLVTFLRVLQNSTAMNTWVLDTPYVHPSLPRQQAEPVYFKLVYDILTSYGTSGSMTLDSNTRGWAISTWWHADEGIPKYDAYDGGLTIAASIRGIPAVSPSTTFLEPEFVLPKLFNVVTDGIRFINRRGVEMILKQTSMTSSQIEASPIFASCKLMDLPTTINLPTLDFSTMTGIGATDYSQAARVLGLLFGVGRVIVAENQYNDFIDPRMEGFVGREFMNCNTRSLTYINTRAPFRIGTGQATLGFTVN
jgi:hypothetical protein